MDGGLGWFLFFGIVAGIIAAPIYVLHTLRARRLAEEHIRWALESSDLDEDRRRFLVQREIASFNNGRRWRAGFYFGFPCGWCLPAYLLSNGISYEPSGHLSLRITGFWFWVSLVAVPVIACLLWKYVDEHGDLDEGRFLQD